MCKKIFEKLKVKKDRTSRLKNLIKNPDGHVFTMEVEGEEIVIRIKKKEIKEQV